MKRAIALLALYVATLLTTTPSYSNDLPVVGISTITSTVDDRRVNAKNLNFQAMLETQMAKVGRFKLIERSRVDEILAEQNLNNAVGDKGTAGGGFYIAGIDYLVFGSITKLGQTTSDVGTGNFRTRKVTTEMAVDVRVVDAATGEIRRAESADAAIETATALSAGGIATADSSADPLAEIQRVVAKRVASAIATSIFPIEVLKVSDVVYLNYGASILSVGDVVTVFTLGEPLIDTASGLNLGAEETQIGELEVIETTDKFSKARLLSGTLPTAGDLVRINANVEIEVTRDTAPPPKRGKAI